MKHEFESCVRLEFSSKRQSLIDVVDINDALAPFGSRIWRLDFSGVPVSVKQLLKQPTLQDTESRKVREYFLLSRERLLELIGEAGRSPQVPGGGEMSTLDLTHDITYPQLYVVAPGMDYSRFDRFHVNTASDGTGVDEVIQVLSGGRVKFLQHLPKEGMITLRIDCMEENSGWVVTYNGAYPHIGSLSEGIAGTKVLVQVIGPEQWEMRYEGE